MIRAIQLFLVFGVLSLSDWLFSVAEAAVIYHSGRGERHVYVDLPVSSTTTINKTVHIDAPAGATVIYTDTPVYPAALPYPPVYPMASSISLRPVSHGCLRNDGMSSVWQLVVLDSCAGGEISEAFYFHQGQVWLNNRCLAVKNHSVGTVFCEPDRNNNWLLTGRQIRDRNSNLCVDGSQGHLQLRPCNNDRSQQFH